MRIIANACQNDALNLEDLQKQERRERELHEQLGHILNHRTTHLMAIQQLHPGEVATWDRSASYGDLLIDDCQAGCTVAWYWVCRGNSGYGGKCNTLILANSWIRKYDDPAAIGQRWYCGCCGGSCGC